MLSSFTYVGSAGHTFWRFFAWDSVLWASGSGLVGWRIRDVPFLSCDLIRRYSFGTLILFIPTPLLLVLYANLPVPLVITTGDFVEGPYISSHGSTNIPLFCSTAIRHYQRRLSSQLPVVTIRPDFQLSNTNKFDRLLDVAGHDMTFS